MNRFVVLTVLLGLSVSGCGTDGPFRDGCQVVLRYGATSYVDAGFSDRHVERLGRARVVSCAVDAGRHRPETVAVWSFPGYDASKVIAVHEDDDTLRVFFARGLSEEERRRLVDARLLDAGRQ